MNTSKQKRYYITFASTNEEKVYSRFFSAGHAAIIGMGIVVGFLIISYGFSYLIELGTTKHQMRTLRHENSVLKKSLASWKDRTDKMDLAIEELKKRNQDIRIAAALPVPEIEYGVGGSEPAQTAYNELPEVNMTETNILQLESELKQIGLGMSQLEESIESRMQQIAHYPSIRPIRGGWLSSGFGRRMDPFTGKYEQHNGIDISTKPGTEVFATAAGRVKKINKKVIPNKGFGKYIIIDHGYGFETLYAHLDKVYVRQGQQIKRWDLIALTGNTGKSTAPHLHYATYKNGDDVNPMNFILE